MFIQMSTIIKYQPVFTLLTTIFFFTHPSPQKGVGVLSLSPQQGEQLYAGVRHHLLGLLGSLIKITKTLVLKYKELTLWKISYNYGLNHHV